MRSGQVQWSGRAASLRSPSHSSRHSRPNYRRAPGSRSYRRSCPISCDCARCRCRCPASCRRSPAPATRSCLMRSQRTN
ncbi:hypothetical protein [Lysobacter gummosus]|uniref:hypothetical protein n=1 Tax=Lysobacter gummosus TaxID=262324 RepID=UPI00362DC13C